jgi:calcineurin-like phosphoesterase family protein
VRAWACRECGKTSADRWGDTADKSPGWDESCALNATRLFQRAWFTSDLHFGHARVVDYCHRPFANVAEMDTKLREAWNERVNLDDVVYVLGDFALGPRKLLPMQVRELNGYLILVAGNHDRSRTAMLAAGFEEYHRELSIVLDGVKLYLRHVPNRELSWQETHDFHLCGHVHEKWARDGRIINVGVDVRDFRPASLAELLETP